MKSIRVALFASVAASPLCAQETREMDAHVHGVSTFELAVEGGVVEMNLLSPGMDIVGFEYEARTDADKDAVEEAIRVMLVPENIVALPDAAECRLTEVLAHLHSGSHDHADEEDHDHEEHDHEEHEHEDHDDDDHEHGDVGEHSEFHVRHVFACEHPEELSAISFPFFERFENARKIEAQYVTHAGAGAAEVTRDVAKMSLN